MNIVDTDYVEDLTKQLANLFNQLDQRSNLFSFANVTVDTIDPESALVSKAVKAPVKNRQLIRQAIASGAFPNLVERLLKHGGKLEDFT